MKERVQRGSMSPTRATTRDRPYDGRMGLSSAFVGAISLILGLTPC